jgi:hypothetical protein
MEDVRAACTSAQHCAPIQKSRAEFRSGEAGQSAYTEVVSRAVCKGTEGGGDVCEGRQQSTLQAMEMLRASAPM